MERLLTDGERFTIAHALKKRAARITKRADAILMKVTPPADEEETETTHQAWVGTRKAMLKAAENHGNLADFILRNRVTVDCLVTIPDQF